MPAFTSFFNFLLLPLPRHPLNKQLSWRLRCSASVQSAPRELAHSFLLPRFSDCPWRCPQTLGPALDSTEATPTCCSLRIPTPAPSATGCVGWCFPRRPTALGPARGACSCGLPPTPSAPGAWPQPQRRSSSFSHPACKYRRTSTPAPPSLRVPVVVCLLCISSQPVSCEHA